MAEFELNLIDIDDAGKDFSFPVRHVWLTEVLAGTSVRAGAADAADELGQLTVHVQQQGADVVFHGRVSATLVTECSRCLEDATITVDAAVGGLYTARGDGHRPVPDEHELTPEELDREFFSGDRVVFDGVVREHLLLEVPIKPLCADECAGIPVPAAVAGPRDLHDDGSQTGAVDPRLAPLLKLVGRVEPTEE